MSSLRNGDEDLHYSDNSHRWVPPDPRISEDVWRGRVQDHLEEHQRNLGGPTRVRRRG